MNNLKRVLSLGLSGVMLAGLLTVGASAADFTDAEKIEHDDAVKTLVALNVIDGKPDGSFDPEGNVTRAEMAKMIAVAMQGGSEATLGTKPTPTFTDIKGTWAESYIEYCSDMGIISGRGDGTFDPTANVTGLEATKMVLTALGYDAEAYKLTGDKWSNRTDELARQADPNLYEELLNVSMAAAASRDTAAQLIWNGLQNTTRRVTPSTNTNTGEVTWKYDIGNLMIYERYGAVIMTGTYVGNYDTGDATNEGEIRVEGSEKYLNATNGSIVERESAGSFPSDLDISNIGEEVRVIYKDSTGKGGVKNAPDKTDTIYGVFNTGATQVIEATRSDIKKPGDGPKATDKVKINGVEYKVAPAPASDKDSEVAVVWNYGISSATVGGKDTPDYASRKDAFENLNASQNGDWVKFVCDDDGRITTAYVVNTSISYVTAVSGDKITIADVGTIKMSENDVQEDLAKNDIVTYTKFYKDKKDEAFYTVKKAESVEGELTAFKGTENLALDGTTYKTLGKTLKSSTIGSDTSRTSFNGGDDIGEQFTAYLVNGYVGYVLQETESANKIAVVIEVDENGVFASNLNAPKVRLLLADGTKVNAVVDKDSVLYAGSTSVFDNAGSKATTGTLASTSPVATDVLAAGQLVRYSVTSSGTYKLVEMKDTDDTNGYKQAYATGAADGSTKAYNTDTKSFGGIVTDGSCVVFAKQDDGAGNVEWKVYNIRDLNSIPVAKDKNYGSIIKDGKVVAGYVEIATRPSGAPGSTAYGIVASAKGTVKVNGDTYYKWTVENDTHTGDEAYEILVDENQAGSVLFSTGDLVYFDPTADNIYNSAAVKPLDGSTFDYAHGLATWVKEYNDADKTITYWSDVAPSGDIFKGTGATTKAVDDDCVIVYINVDDGEGGDNIDISEFDSTTGYRNVILVKDSGATVDKVVAIIVESSRNKDIMGGVAQSKAEFDAANGVTAAALKELSTGIYVPSATKAGDLVEGLPASSARIFRFTATNTAQTYTVTVKNAAGTTVLTGATPSVAAKSEAFAFIGVAPVACQSTDTVDGTSWQKGQNAPAGTYTVEIKGTSDGKVVLTGILQV